VFSSNKNTRRTLSAVYHRLPACVRLDDSKCRRRARGRIGCLERSCSVRVQSNTGWKPVQCSTGFQPVSGADSKCRHRARGRIGSSRAKLLGANPIQAGSLCYIGALSLSGLYARSRARVSNRVYCFRKVSGTSPVGPLRCFAMISSASPARSCFASSSVS
jgi:hypothetical protein